MSYDDENPEITIIVIIVIIPQWCIIGSRNNNYNNKINVITNISKNKHTNNNENENEILGIKNTSWIFPGKIFLVINLQIACNLFSFLEGSSTTPLSSIKMTHINTKRRQNEENNQVMTSQRKRRLLCWLD